MLYKRSFELAVSFMVLVAIQVFTPVNAFSSSTLQLEKSIFAVGEEINVHFTVGDPVTENAWIGIIPYRDYSKKKKYFNTHGRAGNKNKSEARPHTTFHCKFRSSPTIPRVGYVIEFKAIDTEEGETVESATKSALKQIEDKKYETELLERGILNIKKLAIVFSGKEVFVKEKAS